MFCPTCHAPAATDVIPELVTMSQLSGLVHLSKHTLRGYRSRMPAPYRVGVRGRPSLWDYQAVRPWLSSATFGLILPERFPGLLWGGR